MSGAAALSYLRDHFDACARAGTPRAVWWRDDDATRPGPKLERLVEMAARARAPLALAAIPAGVDQALIEECTRAGVTILQHGISHTNYEPSGKAVELGPARDVETIIDALVEARTRLESNAFLPVLVPPWNRMRDDLVAHLAKVGYRGVSLFGAGSSNEGLMRVDTHIDPIGWHTGRSLASAETLLAMAQNGAKVSGPLGLLTHHIDHDNAIDGFVAAFADLVSTHAGARWISAADAFGLS